MMDFILIGSTLIFLYLCLGLIEFFDSLSRSQR